MNGAAVLLPGTGYTTQRPLLHWCGALLRQRGWHVHEVAWEVTEEAFAEPAAFVERHLAEAFEGARGPRLVVAKSFGCFGLPWALREGVQGVWLTPMLTDAQLRADFGRASERHLAVGGGADPLWTGTGPGGHAAALTVPDADHGLQIPGDWEASLRAQHSVLRRVDEFVAGL